MKNTMIFFCLMMGSTFLLGQAEQMDLADFDALEVSTSVKVTLYQGAPRAEITMLKGDREDLVIQNNGGNLKIKFKSSLGYSNNKKAEISLYTNSLRAVEVAAGARVIGHDSFESDDFRVEASSGGSLDMDLMCENMKVKVTSGGTAKISGQTDKLVAKANSGGSFKGSKLQADQVRADANSGGSARVWAVESIKAEANSGGSIKYKGNPKNKDLETSRYSGGSIRKQ